MEIVVTIFTPSYNRAHTLPRLYESLKKQTCKSFEWLVINDGSTDKTDDLFDVWCKEDNYFRINYLKVNNGGKNRAVNQGAKQANGKYFFIVDSDDLLKPDAVEFVIHAFSTLPIDDTSFIGISSIKADLEGNKLRGDNHIDKSIGYIDSNNLERELYNLQADMAEVFFTERLRQYPFPVWKGEKFTPEAVVWDRMALDGYKLRWFNKVVYLCEYQQGGLSDSSWRLLRDNPMGYAMLFNVRLEYTKGIRRIVNYTLQYISCCFLANEVKMVFRCTKPILATFFVPLGWALAKRRERQISRFVINNIAN